MKIKIILSCIKQIVALIVLIVINLVGDTDLIKQIVALIVLIVINLVVDTDSTYNFPSSF